MSTLEDKILGEKLQYYCSSSEEEDNNNDNEDDCGTHSSHQQNRSGDGTHSNMTSGAQRDWNRWKGYSVNVMTFLFQ